MRGTSQRTIARQPFESRIASVKKRFDVDFDFVSGFPLSELPAKLDRGTFDVVVMSGVLYHLFSPLAGLAIARGFVRNGGLLIVETAAVVADEPAMYWNSATRFGGESNFLPSVACLDYFARFLHMEIIDCAYLAWTIVDGLRTARVAFTCRANTDVLANPGDHFIKGTFHTEFDLAEHLDWKRCLSTLPPVPYEAPSWYARRYQPLPFRALRRATRKVGLKNLSNRIDDAIGNRRRPASYWLRNDCRSVDLAKFCTKAKQQHVTDREYPALAFGHGLTGWDVRDPFLILCKTKTELSHAPRPVGHPAAPAFPCRRWRAAVADAAADPRACLGRTSRPRQPDGWQVFS